MIPGNLVRAPLPRTIPSETNSIPDQWLTALERKIGPRTDKLRKSGSYKGCQSPFASNLIFLSDGFECSIICLSAIGRKAAIGGVTSRSHCQWASIPKGDVWRKVALLDLCS
jgi:hypothetical protein